MDSIKPLPSQAQMPELDYGAKDEEKKQKDKE
jgi:hypothetical protein